MRLTLATVSIAAVLLSGCFHEAATLPPAPGATAPATPTAEVPVWHVGDSWVYAVASPEGVANSTLSVTAETDTIAGAAVYTVRRAPEGRTSFVLKTNLNAILESGEAATTYRFPLAAGTSWPARTADSVPGTAHAEWVTQVPTPVGLFDAFRITSTFPGTTFVEVYYYAPAVKNVVRIENYADGRFAFTATLRSYSLTNATNATGGLKLPDPAAGNVSLPHADVASWGVGDQWLYTILTSGGASNSTFIVIAANQTVKGAPVYTVHRTLGNATSFFRASDLNQMLTNDTAATTFVFPLKHGATWPAKTASGASGTARAEWVTSVVTPYGEVDAFKVTAVFPASNLVEVYYYSPSLKNLVRIENHVAGELTFAAVLRAALVGVG